MNFVDADDQLVSVAQIVRKCPTATLRRAFVLAMQDWCNQTRWLRLSVAGATVAGTAQYALGNDAHLEIISVHAVQCSSGSPVSEWGVRPSDSGGWPSDMQAGRPVRYQYVPEAQFALNPTPDGVYGLLVTIVVQPKDEAVSIPESPLKKYRDVFEAGALAYLLRIPGQPWSNLAAATEYTREFRSGISRGKAEVQRNYNVGSQRVRPRQFVV